jgi:3-methylfumaryl-CoA hydratase
MSDEGGLALEEEHDLVYREATPEKGGASAASEPAETPDWSREIRPDPVLLFRYSALTFNGHRIHYDEPYVTKVENYPGLVVHGPLTATLLLDLAARHLPAERFRRFAFRGVRPLFDTAPFTVNGAASTGGARLWAANEEGAVAMRAELELG